jgi:hypothetical protein
MNTVLKEQLEKLIDDAEVQEHVFHYGKSLILSYKLKNGFTIDGRAAVVDLANFNIEVGRKIAREDAINQLWKLEGYLLQNKLLEASNPIVPGKSLLATPINSFVINATERASIGELITALGKKLISNIPGSK